MVDSQIWCEGHGRQRSGGAVIQPAQLKQDAGKYRCAAAVAVTLSGSRPAVTRFSLAQAIIQVRADVGDEPLT
jgi:hypothetical protein